MRLTQNKKNSVLWHGHVVPKDCFVVFMALQSPYITCAPI